MENFVRIIQSTINYRGAKTKRWHQREAHAGSGSLRGHRADISRIHPVMEHMSRLS